MKKITLLSLIFLVFFACRKDSETTTTTTTENDPPVIIIEDFEEEVIPVTASLAGLVIDEEGNPIENANVKLGSNAEITDENGNFLFKQVSMNAAGTYVSVQKAGYFHGSTRFFPKDGSQNYVTIKLMEIVPTGSLVAGDGGVVSAPSGIKLDFPPNAIVDEDGITYDGTVEVAARWIDPTARDLYEIMPGNLQGVNQFNEEVALGSFGMMAVELMGAAGEELNLGNDQKVELTFPVPDELIGSAPDEIPLWSFNETVGLWVQEGSATLEGNTYVGSVAHFSFWNCDAPFPLVHVSGTVVSDDGIPVVNAWVCVKILSSGWTACGITDNEGYFAGKMPKDEELAITITQNGTCFETSTTNVGPFSGDTDLGNIVVTNAALVTVSGTVVNCAGDPLTNGWITYEFGSQTGYFYLENDNIINASLFNCDAATELIITAVNLDDLEQSDELTYTVSPSIDLGEIDACGNVLDEFVKVTVDGETRILLLPSAGDSVSVTDFWAFNPQSQENFQMNINTNGPGTYGQSEVNFIYFFLEFPTLGILSMECGNPDCGVDELNIVAYGNVGEKITGSVTGTTNFYDNMGNTLPDLPYTIEFEVYRDF